MFFNRRIIQQHEEEWQFETTRWVIDNFGGLKQIRKTPLVLPTKEYFPTKGEQDHKLAKVLWRSVQKHAGMEEWLCELRPQPKRIPTDLSDLMTQKFDKELPLGTYRADGDERTDMPIITYDPETLSDPVQLIATLAHESAHFLMETTKEAPPGGWDLEELATDFLTVMMGFGIFLANSAFHFSQFSDGFMRGWESRQSGYLSENGLVHALSIFLHLKDEPVDVPLEHLKPHLRSLLKRAYRRHAKSQDIEKLRMARRGGN